MARKKWDEPAEDEPDVEVEEAEEQEVLPPEPTTTEASEAGVYVVDSDGVAIKDRVYKRGDKVSLTPEELESVQAVGIRILPAG